MERRTPKKPALSGRKTKAEERWASNGAACCFPDVILNDGAATVKDLTSTRSHDAVARSHARGLTHPQTSNDVIPNRRPAAVRNLLLFQAPAGAPSFAHFAKDGNHEGWWQIF
jgi:hypothetical protein